MNLIARAAPPRRRKRIALAFPSSVISQFENPTVRSLRLASIARAAAIFRVDELLIYLERDSETDRRLQDMARVVLEYLATPQYLRRRAFRKSGELKCVGVLPPLRSPSHTVPDALSDVRDGDFREGVIIRNGSGQKVDVGLGVLFNLTPGGVKPDGKTVLVKVSDVRNRKAEVVRPEELPFYWCYRVGAPRMTLSQLLRARGDSIKIGTSRYGRPLEGVLAAFRSLLEEKQRVLMLFGSPTRGLSEILAEEKVDLGTAFDLLVNTASEQGVATIRTEEAIMISLAVLNDIIP